MFKKIAVVAIVLILSLTSGSAVMASSGTEVSDMMNVYTLVEIPRDGGENIIVDVFYFDEVGVNYFFSLSEISAITENGFVPGKLVRYDENHEYFMTYCKYSDEVCVLISGLKENGEGTLDFYPAYTRTRSIPQPKFSEHPGVPPDFLLYSLVDLNR